MSNDIVQRLRDAVPYGLEDPDVLRDAANEIERLRSLSAWWEDAANLALTQAERFQATSRTEDDAR
jgi:hypothetical protein